ncbi:uncharacterized protein SOCE26_042470 [Sorangium cellulosum]|uniref:DUF2169 domain-containing protein n=1 Tax=Sorangium cellulosum TaxID=56 RepID=A0A2L0EU41_SORCE|nr:DUF2169 domain-containing protein [Sorangium cellulosum]AUX42813.1 uncharacterized protein SOCE26_042470 [Sorangium cellulosum]
MKLRNETRHPALLLRTASARSDDHMLGCAIARPTYRVAGGALVGTPDEPWPISGEPAATALGKMPGDKPFYMGGIDVLLGGKVRQPGGAARPRLDVELEVGRSFRRRIAVLGDRTWVPGAGGTLVPSEPEPFVSMELDYGRAFGGTCPTDYGLDMPFTPNPAGRGFYLDAKRALGKPLPNLEDPNRLLRSFDDTPDPVGLGYYPGEGALRVKAATSAAMPEPSRLAPDRAPEVKVGHRNILPTFFNMGHPGMMIEAGGEPRPGDGIRLTHGLRGGDLAFVMPDLRMHIHVQLEGREYVFPMHLDQIGIVAGEGRVFFSLRCVFEYHVRKEERRTATLHDGPTPAVIPGS